MKKFCIEIAFSSIVVPGAVIIERTKLTATVSREIFFTRLRDFRAETFLRLSIDGLMKLIAQTMIASMVSNRNNTAV
ncbi:hypothetical protein D3C80_2044140 [compost metagenome]